MIFRKFSKYIIFLFLLGLSVFLYSFSSKRNSKKVVDKVVVEFEAGANNFLTHAMVNKILTEDGTEIKNQKKGVLNVFNLENMVIKNPYVENAAVFLSVTGTLKTIIRQRTAVARIMGDNSSYYIDKEGVMIPLSGNYTPRVLLISGVKNKINVKEMLSLVAYITKDNFLKKEIVGIEKLEDNNYQFSVRSGNYKIEFGKLSEIDVKFKKLKAFYNKAFVDKTIKNYKKINLKYHNQVVCTK